MVHAAENDGAAGGSRNQQPLPVRRKPERSWRWVAKIKTGCLTCRERRVKCDERSPTCQRCENAGFFCAGYSVVSQRVQRSDQKGTKAPALPLRRISGPSPLYETSSPTEKGAFHIFCQNTVSSISSGFDERFWEDVARASLSFPVIWHAVVALSTSHQRHCLASEAARRSSDVFRLTHYNTAVAHLVELTRQLSLENTCYWRQQVIMMANMLFTTMSMIQGESKEVMDSLRHGLELFYKWQFWGESPVSSYQTSEVFSRSSFTPLMYRLEGFVLMTENPRPWQLRSSALSVPTTPFMSSEDAYFQLQPVMSGLLMNYLSGAVYRASPTGPDVDARLPYQHALSVWTQKYRTFKDTQPQITAMDAVLKLWSVGIRNMMQKDASQVEVYWDKCRSIFQRIVEAAEDYLARDSSSQRQVDPLYAPSICDGLVLVADRCREPVLRRKALSLMISMAGRGRLWDLRIFIAKTQVRIKFDEASVAAERGPRPGAPKCDCVKGEFLCADHRILSCTLEPIDDRTAKVSMQTIEDLRLQQPGHVEIVEW